MLYFELFLSFLQIGLFSIGGGYAAIPMIQSQVVENHAWLSMAEFTDLVTIAEMTPGPIAVNSSTFVGYNLFGIPGGIICSICTLLVPFILALIVSVYFTKFKDNIHLKNALSGIRPVVIGLIAASCLSVAKISITSVYSLIFFAIALAMVWKFKINPIITLIVCGVLGAGLYGWVLPIIGL